MSFGFYSCTKRGYKCIIHANFNFQVMPSSKPEIVSQNLPIVQAVQRHELTLLRLDDLLRYNVSGDGPICTLASDLCARLLDFAIR